MAGYDPTTKGTLDPVLSYAFNANAPANSPLSYQSLLMRRKIAEALLSKRDRLPFPKNLGEGLSYASEKLADAFTDRSSLERLDEAERRQAAGEAAIRSKFPGYSEDATTPSTGTTATSASGVPPVPYVPSGPGSVPLPRARPTMDYSPSIAELERDPETAARLAATSIGESDPNASLAARQAQYASTLNRAQAGGMSVKQALTNGYYPPGSAARGASQLQTPEQVAAFRRDIADPVLSGMGDPAGFGFPPTQNASGGVAARGEQSGRYSPFARLGGETYGQKAGEGAALERFRNPFGPPATPPVAATMPPTAPGDGREAITAAMLSQTPIEQQPIMGGAPGTPVQTASLGPPAGGGSAAALPPSYLSPDLLAQPPAPPVPGPAEPAGGGPAAALPPAAPNPVILAPPGLQPRPVQTAQTPTAPRAGAMEPSDLYKEKVLTPSAVIVPHPGPEISPPKVPAPTPAMQMLLNVQGRNDVSLELKADAKLHYDRLAEQQKLQYQQDLNLYEFKRGKRETDLAAHEKSVRERDLNQAALQIKQLEAAAAIEQNPLKKQQLEAQINNDRINYVKSYQEIYKQPTTQIGGALYRETPAVPEVPGSGLPGRAAAPLERVPGSPPPTLTSEQAKAVTFVRDVLPDMDLLETKLNHGMALATSPGSSLGSALGGKVGLQNILVSKEYREAENAIGRFKGAVMQHLSGAAVSPTEAERNLPAFIPRYGDSEEEVLRKAERRRNYVNAVAATAGQGGDAIEQGRKLVMQANSELPPVKVNSLDELKKLGAGQRVILPDGSPGRVPWPKNLLPQ